MTYSTERAQVPEQHRLHDIYARFLFRETDFQLRQPRPLHRQFVRHVGIKPLISAHIMKPEIYKDEGYKTMGSVMSAD